MAAAIRMLTSENCKLLATSACTNKNPWRLATRWFIFPAAHSRERGLRFRRVPGEEILAVGVAASPSRFRDPQGWCQP